MAEDFAQVFEQYSAGLSETKRKLEAAVIDALNSIPHIDRIGFRVKSRKSFLDKANRKVNGELKYDQPFEEIEDIIAGRVLVFFKPDIEVILQKLDKLFNPVEGFVHEPSHDAEFGYESVHRVYHIGPLNIGAGHPEECKYFEMQVRTLFMHAYAEPQHDLGYKGDMELDRKCKRRLAWIAASAWGADEAYELVLQEKVDNGNVVEDSQRTN